MRGDFVLYDTVSTQQYMVLPENMFHSNSKKVDNKVNKKNRSYGFRNEMSLFIHKIINNTWKSQHLNFEKTAYRVSK